MFKKFMYLCLVTSVVALSAGCKGTKGSGSNKVYKDQVVVHALSDAKGLNPITTSDAETDKICLNIYQGLLGYNNETMKLEPVLAVSLPELKVLDGNKGLELTYELRPEAQWDNGQPVTVDDFIFSLKASICPKVTNDHISTLDLITDVRVDAANPRKFTVVFSAPFTTAFDATGRDVRVMPEYMFDPKHVLRKYSIPQLQDPNSPALNDKAITEFADFFNGEKSNRDPEFVSGSGAYKLEKWLTDQRIILVRKANWWGDKLQGTNQYFDAFPKRLVYERINDFNTAFTALLDEKIDVIYSTPVKEYVELDNSDKFKENYVKSEPNMLVYAYLGMNMRDKILSDVKVRQALSMLVNVDQIIEKVLYGNGTRVVGPVLPSLKDEYNSNIKPYPYDIAKAKQLLAEAGWSDSDGDGVLDKVINGQKTPFEIRYMYNKGNPLRETVGLLCQQWFKQAGIKLEIKDLDWALFQDELKKGNSQMFYGSWIMDPRVPDFKQTWHTTSRNGGSNYAGFGNAQTDALIEKINNEMDPAKRNPMIQEFQQILHDQAPNIFLYTSNFRNAIHKRFEHVGAGPVYPGYWVAGFKVKDGYKVQSGDAAAETTTPETTSEAAAPPAAQQQEAPAAAQKKEAGK